MRYTAITKSTLSTRKPMDTPPPLVQHTICPCLQSWTTAAYLITYTNLYLTDMAEIVTRKQGREYKIVHIVRFEVFTAVTMKNGIFWDVTPCGACKNRRFGGNWRLLHQGDKNW
jgi:hypothetical protein